MKSLLRIISEHKYFCLLFLFGILLFFGDFIFFGKSMFFGDVYWYFIPVRSRISEQLRNFSFPFWTNSYDGGTDLLGSSTFGLLSLVQLPYYFLKDQIAAYNLIIIQSFVFLAASSYIFFLYKLRNKVSAAFASSLYVFFGSSIVNYLYSDLMLGFAVLPLCFYLSERFVNEGKKLFLLFISILTAFQIYNGHPQTSMITIVGIYSYLFVQMLNNRFDLKKILFNLIWLAFAFFLGFGLAAPQLYPLYVNSKLSTRIAFDLSGSISLYPYSLVCAGFYNLLGADSENSFIGPPMGHNLDLYLGFLTLFFFVYGLKNLKKNKEIKVYIILFVFSLFVALGRFSPLYFIIKTIPVFRQFRGIERFVILINLFELLIAGWGFHFFIKNFSENKLNFKIKYSIIIIAIFVLTILSGVVIKSYKTEALNLSDEYIKIFSEGRAPEFLRNLEKGVRKYPYQYYHSKLNRYFDTVSNHLIIISVIPIIFFTGLIFFIKFRLNVSYLYIFIFLLYLFDWFEYSSNFKLFIEKSFFTDPPATLSPLLTEINKTPKKNLKYRYYNINVGNMELPFKYYSGFKKSYEPFYHLKKFLTKNTPVYYGLGIFNGENTMETLRFYKVRAPIKYGFYKLLSYASTKYIYTAGTLPEEYFIKLDSGDTEVNFYEYKFPLPRFYCVSDFDCIKNDYPSGENDDKILAVLNSREFEHTKKIIIEEEPETKIDRFQNIEKLMLGGECIHYSSQKKIFKINASSKCFFVLTDSYDLDWECEIDGEKTKIYRTNYLYQSVIIQPGEHTIVFSQKLDYFKTGLIIFFISAGIAVLFFCFQKIYLSKKNAILK